MTRTKRLYRSAEGEKAVMALYRETLARWPVPYMELRITTRHGQTFVLECGGLDKPPLVLLHGAGTNSAMWVRDVVAYSNRFRMFLIDLPGEAGRSSTNRIDWGGSACTEWMEDVLDGLEIPRASMIGLSQGGFAALRFAASRPQRVHRLVLLAPAGVAPDRIGFPLRALPLSLLGSWGARRICRMLAAGTRMSQEAEDAVTLILTHFIPAIGILPVISDADLASVSMPVMLVIGVRDPLRSSANIARRLRGVLPGLEVVTVPHGGHFPLGCPAQLMSFLAREAQWNPRTSETPRKGGRPCGDVS